MKSDTFKENLKNKFLLILIGIICVFGLVGCNETGGNGKDPKPTTPGTPYTDALKLTRDYEGKEFLKDGIGVVTLANPIDGDTAFFRSAGKVFSVRFLGIDTPESTYKVEPWGPTAAEFTKNKLNKAKQIILESDKELPEKDKDDRYLAYVWVDGRLLNLELVEESLAWTRGLSGLKYQQQFNDADYNIQKYKLRIWGTEKDPNFDYSLQGIEVSLKDVRDLPKGRRVRVQGIVTRVYGFNKYQTVGGYSAYIQEFIDGEWYGVYVYGGFSPHSAFKPGYGVVIEGTTGEFTPTGATQGIFQITDAEDDSKIKLVSMGHQIDPITVPASEVKITNKAILNLLVKVEGLTPNGKGSNSDGGGFTLQTTQGVDIRVDGKVFLFDENNNRFDKYEDLLAYINGRTFTIVGPVSEFINRYQIMLTDLNDLVFQD